ncbi:hypothetical protein E2320_018022, partial [Naja naja]
MVSLLQDQARITFPSLDPLESNRYGDRMQACEESGSPARQEHPAFHRQRPEGHGRPDRNPPGSPPSSGASPPRPEQLFARFPAGQQQPLPRETPAASYTVPPPAEKFRRSAYEEGGPRGGRFAKGALRTPFHPYQRQVPEEPFPAAAQEGFEETRQAAQGFPPPMPHLGPEPAWSSNGMQYGRLGQEPHYLPSGALPLPFLSAPHHSYQRMGPPGPQQPPPPPLFPKPIYSYSILIFMALKNSKTGSLPVSEIYNFMTEHFPYFK